MSATPFQVCAERLFRIAEMSGEKNIVLQIGVPTASENGDYYCEVRLVGLENERGHRVYGLDSLQALQLALKFAAVRLHSLKELGIRITLDGEDDIGL